MVHLSTSGCIRRFGVATLLAHFLWLGTFLTSFSLKKFITFIHFIFKLRFTSADTICLKHIWSSQPVSVAVSRSVIILRWDTPPPNLNPGIRTIVFQVMFPLTINLFNCTISVKNVRDFNLITNSWSIRVVIIRARSLYITWLSITSQSDNYFSKDILPGWSADPNIPYHTDITILFRRF